MRAFAFFKKVSKATSYRAVKSALIKIEIIDRAHYYKLRSPSSHPNYRFFFLPTSSTRLCSFRLFLLLSSQTLHPLSAKSSSTTKSLHLPILPTQLSNPTSTHPSLRAHCVAPNQATAHPTPAIHPTATCVGVW